MKKIIGVVVLVIVLAILVVFGWNLFCALNAYGQDVLTEGKTGVIVAEEKALPTIAPRIAPTITTATVKGEEITTITIGAVKMVGKVKPDVVFFKGGPYADESPQAGQMKPDRTITDTTFYHPSIKGHEIDPKILEGRAVVDAYRFLKIQSYRNGEVISIRDRMVTDAKRLEVLEVKLQALGFKDLKDFMRQSELANDKAGFIKNSGQWH
jgi:hypothetical protein